MYSGILISLCAFIQLGVSYYLSVASFFVILTSVAFRRKISAGAKRVPVSMAASLLMFVPLIMTPSLDLTQDILKTGREALLLCLLMAAAFGLALPGRDKHSEVPNVVVFLVVVAMLLLTVVQSIELARGVYFGIPPGMFSVESGTLPSELDLKYTAGYIRPTATFSEPSYLAFVLTSLALALKPRLRGSWTAVSSLLFILIMGLLSRSLAFFLAAALVLLLPDLLRRRGQRAATVFTFIVLIPLMALTSASEVLGRLGRAVLPAMADSSTQDRIFAPLLALPSFLLEHPFGVPSSTIRNALAMHLTGTGSTSFEVMQNGLFNLLFAYGLIFAVLSVVLIARASDMRSKLYILCCMMFNGSFLSIDKIGVMIFALALYEEGKRRSRFQRLLARGLRNRGGSPKMNSQRCETVRAYRGG